MLSILIPTYNCVCFTLVESLQRQAEGLGMPYEIIVADDGSRDQVGILANLKINELPHCRYLLRHENVGRAAIRNVLVREAQGDLLLMMDADGAVVSPSFLMDYIEAAGRADVVCGGVTHPRECPDPTRRLRWKYERHYEDVHGCVSPEFRSFCFLMHRRVATAVPFDEQYRHYGYEDVQFGRDLQRAGFSLLSIPNPLLNTDIEPSPVFLRKTEEALRTACSMQAQLGQSVMLLRLYRRVAWVGPLLRVGYRLLGGLLRRHLTQSSNPRLPLFSLYRLLYFSSLRP